MRTSTPTPPLGAAMALAAASAMAVLIGAVAGPAWVHWIGSLVAIAAALAVVVIAELTWQGAVNNATAEGLVEDAGRLVPDRGRFEHGPT